MQTTETDFPRLPMHDKAIAEQIAIAREFPDALAHVVLDGDEVTFATRVALAEILYTRACQLYPDFPDKLSSPDEAIKNGIRKTFTQFISPLEYEFIWQQIEAEQEHLKNAPLVDPLLPEIIAKLNENGFPVIGLITARGADAAQLTEEEMVRAGLPRYPVFAMYPGNDLIVPMKIAAMKELAQALGKPVIIIDDNADLILALQDLGDPLLIGILYETERFKDAPVPNERRGVWRTMPEVVRRSISS